MKSEFLQFQVSAPGKVILHGEHSVVFGKPAIAAAISARNYLIFKEHQINTNDINFSLEAFNFAVNLKVNDFNLLLAEVRKNSTLTDNDQNHVIILNIIKDFIKNKEIILVDDNDERRYKSILCVLYLMTGIFASNKKDATELSKGFTLELKSEIEIGAGLGSSASFAVCLATAFLILLNRYNSPDSILTMDSKQFISEWAFNSEKIMHGTPSGIDNTICTFGGIIKYTKGLPIKQVNIANRLNILLVNTMISRDTGKFVASVKILRDTFPQLIDSILESMGHCADEAVALYENNIDGQDVIMAKLSEIVRINSGLLKAIGASHYKLEEIFQIALKYNFPSKLTGAGGGGYAIILLPENYKTMDAFENLCGDLKSAGFEWRESSVGGSGVTVEYF